MKTKKLLALITPCIVASAVQPAFQARAGSPETPKAASPQLATGQYITPTALRGSTQQFLNPQLPAYPSFVAGEAVRSQLSPDGTTLAILCAGQNSLDDAAGNLDVANSTQYIFLYDVSGSHKQAPVLTQVIQQTNAHARKGYSGSPLQRSTDQSGFFIRGQAPGDQAVHTASDIPISAYSTGSDAWRSFVGVQKNTDVFFKLMQALGAGDDGRD